MIAYLDTSVLLRRFFQEKDQIEDLSQYDRVYSSVLLRIESKRVLHRLLLEHRVSDDVYNEHFEHLSQFIAGIYLIEFSKSIQRRAEEPFIFGLGTLDAIHLSSALAFRGEEPVAFLTHDGQLAKNAKAVGFSVVGV